MSTSKQDRDFENLMKDQFDVTVSLNTSAVDTALDFVRDNFSPEDVFDDRELSRWAEANGYTKE